MMGRKLFRMMTLVVMIISFCTTQVQKSVQTTTIPFMGDGSTITASVVARDAKIQQASRRLQLRQNEAESPNANETALVFRTATPIHPLVLERIYELALHVKYSSYDFWILVDETKTTGSDYNTSLLLDLYFSKRNAPPSPSSPSRHLYHDEPSVRPPRLFFISENKLLKHFPKLSSYIYNHPERNFHNDTGLCCDRSIMWQMFAPAISIFMRSNQQYRFVWSIEDDITVHGYYSLYDVIRLFDLELDDDDKNKNSQGEHDNNGQQQQQPVVDLAAVELQPANKAWGYRRHTMGFEKIVQDLRHTQGVRWMRFSDSLQRHSRALSDSVYHEVANNVFQFGEAFIQPIAWKHNHTVTNLISLLQSKNNTRRLKNVFGLETISGSGKMARANGIVTFLQQSSSKNTNHHQADKDYTAMDSATPFRPSATTLVFHEELPSYDETG